MLHGQTIAQLEEGLAIPLDQFVKNCTTRRSSDCLEDIAHTIFIGKSRLACQESCGEQSVATRLPLRGVERLRAVNGQFGERRDKPACCRGCKSPTGKEVANPS